MGRNSFSEIRKSGNQEQQVIVLLGKIPGRHYNYREILPGVIAAKSSAPLFARLHSTFTARSFRD